MNLMALKMKVGD